ncbi:MAG: hypothetical protein ACYCPP_00290 [Nitrososphaerales archaeon]
MPKSKKSSKTSPKKKERNQKSEARLLDKEAVEVETEEEIGKQEFGRENP